MNKVFVLTRKECIPDENQTEVTIVGVYDNKSVAELQAAEEREKIVKEYEKEFSEKDINVSYIGDLTIIDLCDNWKSYYIEISEFEINKTVNAFV